MRKDEAVPKCIKVISVSTSVLELRASQNLARQG